MSFSWIFDLAGAIVVASLPIIMEAMSVQLRLLAGPLMTMASGRVEQAASKNAKDEMSMTLIKFMQLYRTKYVKT